MNLAKSTLNGYYCPQDSVGRLSVNDTEARFISEFARGKCVLEIGTGLGVSTRKMAEVARLIYTVDVDPWVKQNIAPSLPENVKFFNNIDDYGIRPGFDMAFVDGSHEYEKVLKDIRDVKRLVRLNGSLIFHDYAIPAVSRALFVSKVETITVHTFAGLGVAWNE